ncbi:MAG: ABC transporter ATP-binding protein, partial [Spirochaetaceae bacterium]
MSSEYILELKDLHVHYVTDDGTAEAVNGIDLKLKPGETLGLVGETGAGKTTTALSIMRLVPDPPGRIVAGDILFRGESLLRKTEREMRRIRGNKITII